MCKFTMLSVVFLHTLLVLSSCSELHDKVFRNLLRICPEQYVPTDNGTAVNHTFRTVSCCTDYFNQSLERMISSNKTNFLDYQTCLYPTTHPPVNQDYQIMKSYYIITNAPLDGCVILDKSTIEVINDSNQPTCNESELLPFKRFLPVYSKSSGFIYKSPNCAHCHGLHELVDWTVHASSPINAPFEHELTNCKLQFVYPGPVDDIQHLECFTDKFNSCPDKFAEDVNIPPKVDLSVNELTQACAMDGLPRFEYEFLSKNVFCYICHYCHQYTKCDFTESLPLFGSDGRGKLWYDLLRVLDSRVIKQTMYDNHQDEIICGLEPNKQICHAVMCPQGQVMAGDGKSRKCQMDSTRWVAADSKFVMWLLLDFDHNMTINDAALERLLRQKQARNPWQASWNIVNFFRPFARNIDMAYANGDNNNMSKVQMIDLFNHAYVLMSYKQTSVNPATFVREIEQTLPKMWSFKIDNSMYRARQTFSSYTIIKTQKGVKRHTDVDQYGVPSWVTSSALQPRDHILYKVVVKAKLPHRSADITKLLFCRRVEVFPTYFYAFTLDQNKHKTIALYYNRTGKYLFDNEFTVNESNRKFTICITDTEIISAANGRGKNKLFYWLLVAVSSK